MSRFLDAFRSEFRKFLTVRSSLVGVAMTAGLTIGFGALICFVMRQQFPTLSVQEKLTFDPVVFAFAGVLFGQFATGVIGAQFITSEFATGAIHTTLASVPGRWTVLFAKASVLKIVLIITSAISVTISFFVGQAILSGPGIPVAHISDPGITRQVILTALYLVLLGLLAMGLGFILRQTAATISVYVVLLLVLPIIDVLMPSSIRDATFKYLPSSLGRSMMSGSQPYVYPVFSPWVSTAIFIAYIVALFGVAGFLFAKRDV
jgi:ABC-2 type transport system permease protein